MSQNRRVGGIIYLKVGSELLQAKGSFTYNIGAPQREAVVGMDGVHGFKETPQVPYIEGEITDSNKLDLHTLVNARDVTVTLQLANGKTIVLQEAWYAADGTGNTEEGNLPVRYEGVSGEEI